MHYSYYVFNKHTITVAQNGKEIGVAICTPKDNFCKKKGRKLAKKRIGFYTDYSDSYKALIQYILANFNSGMLPEKLKKEIIAGFKYTIEPRRKVLQWEREAATYDL